MVWHRMLRAASQLTDVCGLSRRDPKSEDTYEHTRVTLDGVSSVRSGPLDIGTCETKLVITDVEMSFAAAVHLLNALLDSEASHCHVLLIG